MRWRVWLYRVAAMVLFGAAVWHVVALTVPAFNRAMYPHGWYPAWRHLVFIALVLDRRPRRRAPETVTMS